MRVIFIKKLASASDQGCNRGEATENQPADAERSCEEAYGWGRLDDSDGDSLANGLEAWFGTHPGEHDQAFSGFATDGLSRHLLYRMLLRRLRYLEGVMPRCCLKRFEKWN
jgi:hypothetical protein